MQLNTLRGLMVLAAAGAAAACLVISPLDELNDTTDAGVGGAGAAGGAGGTGGNGGSAGSDPDGSAGGGPCTTHESCSAQLGEEPARCVAGVCQPLKSTQCRCAPNAPTEMWRNDQSILIAAFAPLGSGTCGDDVISRNYRLAVEQINVKANGLPGADSTRRPLALVLCDNGEHLLDPTERRNTVRAGMDHVTTKLGVPAVLAYVEAGDLVDSFNDFGKDNGVFFMNPGGVTEAIASTPSPLMWSMLGLPTDIAPTYQALLEALEQQKVQEKLGNPPGSPLKVTLVTGSSSAEVDLAGAVKSLLVFNGVGWQANQTAGRYQEVSIADTSGAASDILDFDPHVVISVSAGDIFTLYDNVDTAYHPYWILSPYDQGGLASIAASVDGAIKDPGIPDLDRTVLGVNAASSEDTDLLLEYTTAYGSKYGAPPGLDSAENIYDSVYYLAYAILAGADLNAVTGFGGAINAGMEAITQTGAVHQVGETDMLAIMGLLSQPLGEIRLHGTLGPPEYFHQPTNVRRSTGAVYCLSPPNGTVPVKVHYHVAHFDGPEAGGPKLRLAKQWQGAVPPPCMGWLNLPKQ